jgi:hypothetical protein
MKPFVFIGKEIEPRAQEGQDISVIETPGQSGIRPVKPPKLGRLIQGF